ncbi:MAG: cobalamin biosynthesis protein [Aulosira sp. ZfuVER01]|nr:cobalamin biosynthesis protein [Aulosira sp. ZfuVER01]MDZ8001042.1 cobalamin biosynthesis protein [Aulosira sp. DedVER01a]MDZ8056251.1 cobalamin biosynthesis protein [Aulosira sp. ZfuCHP01]
MNKKDLWVGIGCQRGTSTQLIEKAIQQVFKDNQLEQSAIAGIATIDNKASEVGLIEFCQLHNLSLKTFPAEILRLVSVPNPAKITEQAMGTPSVAEAAAILAAANIEWQTKTVNEICSTHQFLKLNTNAFNLTPSLTAVGVRCLVPKQIFRVEEEPGAVTIAVAQEV